MFHNLNQIVSVEVIKAQLKYIPIYLPYRKATWFRSERKAGLYAEMWDGSIGLIKLRDDEQILSIDHTIGVYYKPRVYISMSNGYRYIRLFDTIEQASEYTMRLSNRMKGYIANLKKV